MEIMMVFIITMIHIIFDESNDENNVYIISNNFTEFLDMIVKR